MSRRRSVCDLRLVRCGVTGGFGALAPLSTQKMLVSEVVVTARCSSFSQRLLWKLIVSIRKTCTFHEALAQTEGKVYRVFQTTAVLDVQNERLGASDPSLGSIVH